MAAGSPLLKLDTWRPLLEKYAHLPLTTAAHLSELVPPLHRLEENYFREWAGLTERGSAGAQEVDAEKLAVIFDGTTRDGEAFVVLARKINKDTCLPEQRVMAVKLYARTGMKATEIAGALVEIICTRWGIDGKNIICMARDRASSNTAALEHAMFTAVFPNFLDSNCFAHTLCKPPEDCPLETAELLINRVGDPRSSLRVLRIHKTLAASAHSDLFRVLDGLACGAISLCEQLDNALIVNVYRDELAGWL